MFVRALIAFLAMPGMVAFVIPAAWLWFGGRWQVAMPVGLLLLAVGLAGLLWCVRDFYVSGKGTLAPWSPPEHLVVVGLYRYSRNPMYLSVALILLGWSIAFAWLGLFVYTAVIILLFHLRVVLGEEPWLANKHQEAWQAYASRVRRWF